MDTWLVVAIVVSAFALIAVVVVGWLITDNRRRRGLRSQYGKEYDLAVAQKGGTRAGERELREREQRVAKLQLRPLPAASRERYRENWQSIQSRFVDDPPGALRDADRLVADVLRDRGYPDEKFVEREGELATQYPRLVDSYRRAHAVSVRNTTGEANTEELRGAVVSYRALFDELLGDQEQAAA